MNFLEQSQDEYVIDYLKHRACKRHQEYGLDISCADCFLSMKSFLWITAVAEYHESWKAWLNYR